MHSMRENERYKVSCHTNKLHSKSFILLYCVLLLAHSSTCKNQHEIYLSFDILYKITHNLIHVKKLLYCSISLYYSQPVQASLLIPQIGQPLPKQGVSLRYSDISHSIGQGFLCPDYYKYLLCPCDARVYQITLEHHIMVH